MLILFVPRDLSSELARVLGVIEFSTIDTGMGQLLSEFLLGLARRLANLEARDLGIRGGLPSQPATDLRRKLAGRAIWPALAQTSRIRPERISWIDRHPVANWVPGSTRTRRCGGPGLPKGRRKRFSYLACS